MNVQICDDPRTCLADEVESGCLEGAVVAELAKLALLELFGIAQPEAALLQVVVGSVLTSPESNMVS